jgi:hypothetical protein
MTTLNQYLILFFLLPFCISANTTSAVCFEPHPTVCAQFFHSDEVFIGKVISVKILWEDEKAGIIGGWRYHLKVQKIFRGISRSVIDVATENASDRFPLEKGGCYLVQFVKKQSL